MNLAAWNVRGLNGPLTQNKVVSLCRQHNISLFGLLETKMKLERVFVFMNNKFRGWNWFSNHHMAERGRILVIWNPTLVDCVTCGVYFPGYSLQSGGQNYF